MCTPKKVCQLVRIEILHEFSSMCKASEKNEAWE